MRATAAMGRWSCAADGRPAGRRVHVGRDHANRHRADRAEQTDRFHGFATMIVGEAATCLAVDRRPGQRADPMFGDDAVLCIAPKGVILEEDGTVSPLKAVIYWTLGSLLAPSACRPRPKLSLPRAGVADSGGHELEVEALGPDAGVEVDQGRHDRDQRDGDESDQDIARRQQDPAVPQPDDERDKIRRGAERLPMK